MPNDTVGDSLRQRVGDSLVLEALAEAVRAAALAGDMVRLGQALELLEAFRPARQGASNVTPLDVARRRRAR